MAQPKASRLSDDPPNENEPLAGRGACPICGKPTVARTKPFCSKRCANVDLQRWLSGVYAIPAVEDEPDLDDPSAQNRKL